MSEEYLEQQCPLQPSSAILRHDNTHQFFKQTNQLIQPPLEGFSNQNFHSLPGLDRLHGWSVLFSRRAFLTKTVVQVNCYTSRTEKKINVTSLLQGILAFKHLHMGFYFLPSYSTRTWTHPSRLKMLIKHHK